MANRDVVVGCSSNKETCADMDRKAVVSSLFDSVSRAKRDRDQNVVQTLILHKILERKVEREWLSRDCISEAEVEARNWEKRNSDIAFQAINQEFEA